MLAPALAAVAALALAGCGLETIVVLASPTAVSISVEDGLFQFESTAANSELEFRGYEIYYKLFPSEEIPSGPYYSAFEDMIAAGYLRLQNPAVDSPGSQSSPLIVVDGADVGEAFTVTVDFSASLAASAPDNFPRIYLTGTLGGTTTTEILAARRPIAFSGSEYKRFSFSHVDSADADLTVEVYADITDGVSPEAAVLCFAVSFGVTDDSDRVYSIPEYLGSEKISLP